MRPSLAPARRLVDRPKRGPYERRCVASENSREKAPAAAKLWRGKQETQKCPVFMRLFAAFDDPWCRPHQRHPRMIHNETMERQLAAICQDLIDQGYDGSKNPPLIRPPNQGQSNSIKVNKVNQANEYCFAKQTGGTAGM